MGKQQVLIVEDEQEIRELLGLHLGRMGLEIYAYPKGEDALDQIRKGQLDLAVVDWMLPGMSGVEIVSLIKQTSPDTHVLMVTAKAEPENIIAGLKSGADDYLTKPFDLGVLSARAQALLRRASLLKGKGKDDSPQIIKLPGLLIDQDQHEVRVEGEKLHLTPSEFKLLVCMVQNRGKVLTREQLIENVQGEGISVIGRTVDTHVFGLRKKLKSWGDNVETIRGIGYRVRMHSSTGEPSPS
jgi:two-component system phosphate regulon response regulator PhoB